MNILAHRGYWKTEEEKNTQKAFECAFECGFGAELDIRDLNGTLVISHDMPRGKEMLAKEFFELYKKYKCNSCLALNIKADGLQVELKKLIELYKIENYFCFDMSIPDTLGYIKNGLKFFSRSSEFELQMPFYEESAGVWLDCFNSDCIENKHITSHLLNNKQVCIVSSELHKREHAKTWMQYKNLDTTNVMLCTDYPKEAKEYFNE